MSSISLTLSFLPVQQDQPVPESVVLRFDSWGAGLLALADAGLRGPSLDQFKAEQLVQAPPQATSLLPAIFDKVPCEKTEDRLSALSATLINLRILQGYQTELAQANWLRVYHMTLHPEEAESLAYAMTAAERLSDLFAAGYKRLKMIDPNTGRPRWFIRLTVGS